MNLLIRLGILLMLISSMNIVSSEIITPSTDKIYAQDLASFNLTFDEINKVVVTELYNNSIVYTNTFIPTKTSNTTYSITYQLIDKDTDMLMLDVYYLKEGKIQVFTQSYFVFIKPFQDKINWFALGFVIFVACLSTFYTYKYIKHKRF